MIRHDWIQQKSIGNSTEKSEKKNQFWFKAAFRNGAKLPQKSIENPPKIHPKSFENPVKHFDEIWKNSPEIPHTNPAVPNFTEKSAVQR